MKRTVDDGRRVGHGQRRARCRVQVLARQRVGAFDAAVLKADDPTELREWLVKNGYDARPRAGGVAEGVHRRTSGSSRRSRSPPTDRAAGRRESRPRWHRRLGGADVVQDRPAVLPVPRTGGPAGDGPGRGRTLRVYFLADARFDGKLGRRPAGWPGRAVWANRIDTGTFAAVAGREAARRPGRARLVADGVRGPSRRRGRGRTRSTSPARRTSPPWSGRRTCVYEYRTWPAWVGIAAVVGATVVLVAVIGLVTWRLMRARRRSNSPQRHEDTKKTEIRCRSKERGFLFATLLFCLLCVLRVFVVNPLSLRPRDLHRDDGVEHLLPLGRPAVLVADLERHPREQLPGLDQVPGLPGRRTGRPSPGSRSGCAARTHRTGRGFISLVPQRLSQGAGVGGA